MAIALSCPCGKKLEVGDEYAGKRGQCPVCGAILDIPNGDEPVLTARLVAEPLPAAPAAQPVAPAAAEVAPVDDVPLHELPNHNGEALPADVDFFVGPPEGIGPLL